MQDQAVRGLIPWTYHRVGFNPVGFVVYNTMLTKCGIGFVIFICGGHLFFRSSEAEATLLIQFLDMTVKRCHQVRHAQWPFL